MPKVILNNLVNLENEVSATSTINANFERVSDVIDQTLSRFGELPNAMMATLDMNSNRIINLPAPLTNFEPVRLIDVADASVSVAQSFLDQMEDLVDEVDGIVAAGNRYIADRPAMQIASIEAAVKRIYIGGYYAETDDGAAWYKRVDAEPSHLGKVRSLDRFISSGATDNTNGGWWEVDEVLVTPDMYGAKGDDSTNDLASINGALAQRSHITFLAKTYLIAGSLLVQSNNTIYIPSGCEVKQTTADTTTFKVDNKSNVTIHLYGRIRGEGTWSDSWTGQGHFDRGVDLINCTNAALVGTGNIRNCGHAGVSVRGGNGITIGSIFIEGTHSYSTPITSQGNFQNGIFISDTPTDGVVHNFLAQGPRITGTAQGILVETYATVDISERSLRIVSPLIDGIPGQHAFYIQGSMINVSNPVIANTELAGFKVQASDDNDQHLKNIVCTGLVAKDIGSNLFEIAHISGVASSIADVKLSAVGLNVGTGIAIVGNVSNLSAELRLHTVNDNAVLIQGSGATDIDIDVEAQSIGETGVIVSATNAVGLRISPVLRDPNTSNGAHYGILVASESAVVDLYDVVITDSGNHIVHGIYNFAVGSIVTLHGALTISGATGTALNAVGVILDIPADSALSGNAGGRYTSTALMTFEPSADFYATSTSATPVTVWRKTLSDETAYMITAEIVGKLSGTTQRKSAISTVLVYRDGAGATIQTAAAEVAAIASGSFAGVYAWSVSSNDILLTAHSGGATTHTWAARITVTAI